MWFGRLLGNITAKIEVVVMPIIYSKYRWGE